MPLTLRQCLEVVAQLGTDYVVTDQGREWAATDMVAALTRDHPDHLDQLRYLRLPNPQQDGAIYEPTPSGGFILRYRICHPKSR